MLVWATSDYPDESRSGLKRDGLQMCSWACACVTNPVTFSLAQTHIRRPFSECYGGFPSAHRRANYHQFSSPGLCTQWQPKCFPCLSSARLSSPLLSCSVCLSVRLSLSSAVCLEACHSLIFQPLDTSMSVTNEGGLNYSTCCVYFSRIIEICLGCNARSCPQKCFSITHTHTHTGTCTFACESKQKRHLVCTTVGVSICVCARVRQAVYRQH